VNQPETKYARSGDVSIAYQVTGDGRTDIVYVPSVAHHVELNWENPLVARFFERLAGLGRLILFDKRGTGMSDRVSDFPTLETRMDDIRAVMDAVDSESAVVFAAGEGGPLGMLFAATYPERTTGLVLFNTTPRFTRSPELPWLSPRGQYEAIVDEVSRGWGDVAFNEEFARRSNPDASNDEISAFARVFRLSVSPGAAAHYMRMNIDVDVSDVLTTIRVPTLIVHSAPPSPLGRSVAKENAHFLASRIPDARVAELPGRNFGPPLVDQERLFAELERFVGAVAERDEDELEGPERVLATVLFTDIVGATAKASELGDRHWRELLSLHHERIRRELTRHRGREVDTAGDGFFATFDGPARAIRCALAATQAVGELGLEIRAGLHTGECELVDNKVGGIAVHIGARVATQAQPGEVLVSQTVKDLVAGSGIEFEDRGGARLKGVPGEWQLFAVRGE
jgi:class 3 adenylate cyclase/alpha-beta hydrolase superfamily lysophospholipase